MKTVAVIMGSKSDYEVCQQAIKVLTDLGVNVYKEVVSAHRTPERLSAFGIEASGKYDVVIAAAGGSAHLPGMVAAFTNVPVIGLPIKSKALNGVDSLLSIVQMPPGVPVSTVAINGGMNAGLLAAQMLAISDGELRAKLDQFKLEMKEDVIKNHNEAICK
ncbi:5-(carboxyamino)imidazole ribonucleotide mutase [Mollicutes bacterium LVI A0039]|nr:5-(carboxyamino)imidazole ribonucleotide mutase [Mollicutes bacterium LVI A0039]